MPLPTQLPASTPRSASAATPARARSSILRADGDTAKDEESLVTGLLLPDAPVVVWWPGRAPEVPGTSPLGRIAHRRITDATRRHADPQLALEACAKNYTPGDTDFAWTRLTLWRAQLAAVLDQPPYEPVTGVQVSGAADSPSTTLLAAWLHLALQVQTDYELTRRRELAGHPRGAPVPRRRSRSTSSARTADVATLTQPDQPTHDVALPRRNLRDCLADELRRLDPDELYGEVITGGLATLGAPSAITEGPLA